MELAIDTSTETAGIALSSAGTVTAEFTWHAGQNHTVELVPNLNHLLAQSEFELQDIKGVIVAKGPGSFNGLRVGMSFAKGLALSLNIPIVGVSTLEADAFPYSATNLPICPIMNAGRGEIATAVFQKKRGKWQRLIEEHISTASALALQIKTKTIFCGKIPPEIALYLKETLKQKATFIDVTAQLPRVGYLAQLGWKRLEKGDYDNISTLEPLYLRRPAITINKKIGIKA